MSLPEIHSLRNPLIQETKNLQRASERRKQQKFLVEGTHLVFEGLSNGWNFEAIFATETWLIRHSRVLERPSFDGGLIERAVANSLATTENLTSVKRPKTYLVSNQILEAIATTEQPDGVVAVAKMLECEATIAKPIQLGIVAKRLQTPDNLGGLIRSSAAAGSDGIWLLGDSVDSTNPKVLRGTAGQWFRLPPRRLLSLKNLRSMALNHQLRILGATMQGKSLWDHDLTQPTVFVVGNEAHGLSQETLEMVDETISIPMASGIESVNVATTGALLLFEARRQRLAVH